LIQKTSKYWIKPSATYLQENPTHVVDPENIEILDKAISNFTSSHTSLDSIANMQLHTKENTIKIYSSPT